MRKFGRLVSLLELGSLIVGGALLGCASMNATPGWVNGETPAGYPKDRFVSALGTGSSLDGAQTAAKGELSRVFSAQLESELRLIEEETVLGEQSLQGSELRSDTRISSALELQGVEVPMHWRDPRSGEIWALAVLERKTECLRIRSEGRELLTRLDSLVEGSQSATNPLLAIRAATMAVGVGTELDGLQARSRVIGNQCLPPRSVGTGRLRADAETRLRGLSFVIKAEDVDPGSGRSTGPLPQLREQIASNLTALGFQVGPASGARVVPIEARLRLRRVERGTDWVEYRWEGSAEIAGPSPGDPALIAAESEGAESHPEPSTARLRARRKGELDLARKLDERLRAFLADGEES